MPSIGATAPTPVLMVSCTLWFFSRKAPPTGVWRTMFPPETYFDRTLPPMVPIRLLSSSRTTASSRWKPSTSGTIAMFSGTTTFVVYRENRMTPVSNRMPNTSSAVRTAGSAIFSHNGHV